MTIERWNAKSSVGIITMMAVLWGGSCTGQKQDSAVETDFVWDYPSFTVSETARTQLSTDGSTTPEILAWDAVGSRLLAISSTSRQVFTLSMSLDNATPFIDLQSDEFGVPTSIAINSDGVIAVTRSQEAEVGVVQLFDNSGLLLNTVTVGYHPDQVLTHNGRFVVVNEGEAAQQAEDVVGGVSLVTVENGVWVSQTIDFETSMTLDQWNDNGGHAVLDTVSLSKEIEPEYATVVYQDGLLTDQLWITLQEANSIVSFDLTTLTWGEPIGLGAQDHLLTNNNIDASDEDEEQLFKPWPVLGLHQPDGLAHFSKEGINYVITANEGEPFSGFNSTEFIRVKELSLDTVSFPNADNLVRKKKLGRLKVSQWRGDTDQDGDMDVLYGFGSRSFSVWNVDTQTEVYNSGNTLSAYLYDEWSIFNPDNSSNLMDQSSDDSGIAPEAIVVGMVAEHPVAFLGLEKAGGVVVISLDRPQSPEITQYLPSRDFSILDFNAEADEVDYALTGGIAPEGMLFLSAEQSPSGKPVLFVAYEQSGHIIQYTVEVTQ